MVTENQATNCGGYATRRVGAFPATKARFIFKCYFVIRYVTTESLVIMSNAAYLCKIVGITIKNNFIFANVEHYQILDHMDHTPCKISWRLFGHLQSTELCISITLPAFSFNHGVLSFLIEFYDTGPYITPAWQARNNFAQYLRILTLFSSTRVLQHSHACFLTLGHGCGFRSIRKIVILTEYSGNPGKTSICMVGLKMLTCQGGYKFQGVKLLSNCSTVSRTLFLYIYVKYLPLQA